MKRVKLSCTPFGQREDKVGGAQQSLMSAEKRARFSNLKASSLAGVKISGRYRG